MWANRIVWICEKKKILLLKCDFGGYGPDVSDY